MLNYFGAIRSRWPDAWKDDGEGNIINRTNGYNAFMRFLRFAYRDLSSSPTVIKEDAFKAIFDKVSLQDGDFRSKNFPAGSSGEAALFAKLKLDTGLTG